MPRRSLELATIFHLSWRDSFELRRSIVLERQGRRVGDLASEPARDLGKLYLDVERRITRRGEMLAHGPRHERRIERSPERAVVGDRRRSDIEDVVIIA